MNQQITCPQCGKVLCVGASAAEYLSCPRCLAPVENPALAGASPTQTAPIPVVVADEEVRSDLVDTSRLMIVAGVTLIIGAIASLAYVWDAGLAVPAAIVGFLFLMAGICVRVPARRGAGRGGGDYTEPAERRGNVLEYEIRRPQTAKPPPLAAQVVVGFVTWVAAVVAAVAMLQSAPFRIAGSGGVAFGIFVLLSLVIALAVWVRLRFEWRGFIPGLLIGFGITCLLPVGIVAVICGHP